MGLSKTGKPRFLVVQVISKRSKPEEIDAELHETEELITTFGGERIETIIQRLDHPNPNFYLGEGKVEELLELCDRQEINVVIINGQVKSGQLFRIEKELWKVDTKMMVWDRIDLILNIFDQHATTIESKLQIKLARAKHMGPRIYGLGKTELSRQGGGVGTRGKGETNIEFERRQIKIDQQKIKKELKKVLKQKESRLSKRTEMGIGPVALVGYTSAGKTTLFNTLTGKEKEMNKGLFTTLDTVVGKLKTPHLNQPILISDTIGFISNLPPVLIDSFKSTLLESLEARLLLHVVDIGDPEVLAKITVVDDILTSLKVKHPVMVVLNKCDTVTELQRHNLEEAITAHLSQSPHNILKILCISAKTGENIVELTQAVEHFFEK